MCDLPQQGVADRIAEGVVHRLEVVEVEVQHRVTLPSSAACHGFIQPVMKQNAVCQPGQRVVVGHVRDLGFDNPLLSDVLQGHQPAIVLHGCEIHREPAAVRHIQGIGGALAIGLQPQYKAVQFLEVGRQQTRGVGQQRPHVFDRRAGRDAAGGQAQDLRQPFIAHHETVTGIEHAQDLGHIAQGSAEAGGLNVEFPVGPLTLLP